MRPSSVRRSAECFLRQAKLFARSSSRAGTLEISTRRYGPPDHLTGVARATTPEARPDQAGSRCSSVPADRRTLGNRRLQSHEVAIRHNVDCCIAVAYQCPKILSFSGGSIKNSQSAISRRAAWSFLLLQGSTVTTKGSRVLS